MEYKLSRRVIKQPLPHINEGGDCGPCVLAGVLGYIVPAGNSHNAGGGIIKSIHKKYLEEGAVSLGRHGMIEALDEARREGLIEDYINDTPTWDVLALPAVIEPKSLGYRSFLPFMHETHVSHFP